MDSSQCYKLLGVSEGAPINEIKDAYRRLALEYHPDKNTSAKDGVKFKMIAEAYHTLRVKNSSYTRVNDATKYHTMNKSHQYEKDSFLDWLNFLCYKIDHRYVKYVRIIFFYYLKYEPTLFEYSDKIEKKAFVLTHRSIEFFRHECVRIIFRIMALSSKSIHIPLTTKEFNFSVMLFSFKNHLKTKER
ncbi:DnaJ domain-containing protein [Candidatus Nitrosotalea bavarica]|uniref:DnaJ domain-containing protein n=1 Tax=Candidatus Nitrosotalea bavarica TaxID=1903277 RepID=UPI000C704B62|nr:J domain-containing protein [Candidatus Nitrosotalea bavarica]